MVDRAGGYAGLPVVRFTPTLHPTGGLRWATTGGVMLLSCNDERKATTRGMRLWTTTWVRSSSIIVST